MRRRRFLWLILVLCIGIETADARSALAEQPPRAAVYTANVVNSGNKFALELYAKLRTESAGNFLVSPHSVFDCLTMAYAGAREQTAKEMVKVLHLDFPRNTLPEAQAALAQKLTDAAGQSQCEFKTANRIWSDKGFSLLPEFQNTLRAHYGAELKQLNFGQPASAAKEINAWIDEQTNGKIQNLIDATAISSATSLVLTNAVYFKADWEDPFKKESTRPRPFFPSADKQIDVPMMFQQDTFQIGTVQSTAGDGLQILKLPYKGNRFSMLVLLPQEKAGLEQLESQLSAFKLGLWNQKLKTAEVNVSLPKFKQTHEVQMSKALAELGMPAAFQQGVADFSGIDGKRSLFISQVRHKAFVDVAEEGTEAAAATAIVAPTAAAPGPSSEMPKIQTFNADHPFVFLIQDDATGCILFIGRVKDPR